MSKTSTNIKLFINDTDFRAKFSSLINKTINQEECWPWLGTLDHYGYGQISYQSYPYKAHRLSYLIHNTDIVENEQQYTSFCQLMILHSCDNPQCVNPHHLSLGTYVDNLKRASERDRFPDRRGDNHPIAKLSQEQVTELQTKYAAGGITQRQLAKEYAITPQWVSSLINDPNTWANLPKVAYGDNIVKTCQGEKKPNVKLNEVTVKEIRKRFAEGNINYAELGRLLVFM
jgi:hypothetical protein